MGGGLGLPAKRRGPSHGQGGLCQRLYCQGLSRAGTVGATVSLAGPGPAWPIIFHIVGRGRARPFMFIFDRPRPGQAHHILSWDGPCSGPSNHFFRGRAVVQPGPSIVSEDKLRPGPAHRIHIYLSASLKTRPGPSIFFPILSARRRMTFAARLERHGLQMGRLVDLKSRYMGRPTGWPMCYPVLKSANWR